MRGIGKHVGPRVPVKKLCGRLTYDARQLLRQQQLPNLPKNSRKCQHDIQKQIKLRITQVRSFRANEVFFDDHTDWKQRTQPSKAPVDFIVPGDRTQISPTLTKKWKLDKLQLFSCDKIMPKTEIIDGSSEFLVVPKVLWVRTNWLEVCEPMSPKPART